MTMISTIGLDIAKQSFYVHCEDAEGKVVEKKELKRSAVLGFFEKLERPCLVGIEACGTAHHWAREVSKLGHEVKLIPPARVKALVLRQKNDAADARAICEAVKRSDIHFVPVKSADQQSLLMLMSVRDGFIGQRTELMNRMRGHFAEIGIVVPSGGKHIGELVARVKPGSELSGSKIAEPAQEEGALEDGAVSGPVAEPLPAHMLIAMGQLVEALEGLNARIAALDQAIGAAFKSNPVARRVETTPGIGQFTAMLLVALFPDPKVFAGGREFAAFLGMVPKQNSTGGKARLGAITKMGNRDVRSHLFVGAVAVLWRLRANTGKIDSPLARWAKALLEKKPFRLVAMALANKLARIAWVLMARGGEYDPAFKPAAAKA